MAEKGKKDKIDFKKRKENVCNSLFEVEHFLCNLDNIARGFKLYKVVKKRH